MLTERKCNKSSKLNFFFSITMSTEKINYTTEQKSAYFVYKNLVLFGNINDEDGSLINLNKEKSRACNSM